MTTAAGHAIARTCSTSVESSEESEPPARTRAMGSPATTPVDKRRTLSRAEDLGYSVHGGFGQHTVAAEKPRPASRGLEGEPVTARRRGLVVLAYVLVARAGRSAVCLRGPGFATTRLLVNPEPPPPPPAVAACSGESLGRKEAGKPTALCGLDACRTAKAVERALQDRLDVAGVAVDLGDRGDHVQDLFEVQVGADRVGALCAGQ